MNDKFFFEHMLNIMHSPVWIYNDSLQLIEKIGTEENVWWVLIGKEQKDAERILKSKKEYPIICVGENDNIASVIYSERENRSYIFGPVTLSMAHVKSRELCNVRLKKGYADKRLSYCPFDVFISGTLLVYWKITGREMNDLQLLNYNRENFERIKLIQKRISEDMFIQQENYGKHNPSEQELRELESIENGDEEALRESISETYEGTIGILAKTPLRHHKNVAIGNITLASRAAIRGGLNVESSFSMADSMIQQVEEINNVPEVEMFKRECQFVYAAAVNEAKKRRGKSRVEKENPIVGKVKDYIFNNLHSKIKVSDIAEALKVNSDYLSYVFSRSENTTIKKYILEEKIRRSQNLLKYSDYQIKEISFYLGFCSQSHFTKAFYEITGVKPNDYRKKYGNREKWK